MSEDVKYSPNLGLALFGADAVTIENFIIIDAFAGGPFGTAVDVNGAPVSSPNFNGTVPAAPGGNTNVTFQVSGSSISAYVPTPAAGGVTSFNTRTGAVVPLGGDYSAFYAPISVVGTVTSFSAGALSPLFTTSVATATTTPALTFALNAQNANLVFAGPASGAAAASAFRALVAADIPTLSYMTNPMTTLGDIIYENATPAPARLAGNTTATKEYLSQTGNGTISAAPAWAQVNYADIAGTTPTPPSGSVLWSALGNAAANLTLSNAAFTTEFDQTSAATWLWKNTTVASAITTNASPLLELAANYWTGAASAQDLWTISSSLAAGTNGISTLTIAHSGSTGAAALTIPGITAGSSTTPQIKLAPFPTYGFGMDGSANFWIISAGHPYFEFASAGARLTVPSTNVIQWNSTSQLDTGSADTALSRTAAGFLGVGTGAAGSVAGTLVAQAVQATWNGTLGTPTTQILAGDILCARSSSTGVILFGIGVAGAGASSYWFWDGATMQLGTGANLNVQGGVYKSSGNSGVFAGPFTAVTSITSNGGIVTALSGTSDERLKNSVQYKDGLETILAIDPIQYTWNEAGQAQTGLAAGQEFVGFSAQNLQKALPLSITGTEKSKTTDEVYLCIDDRPVLAALVNAVKELKAEIDAMKRDRDSKAS